MAQSSKSKNAYWLDLVVYVKTVRTFPRRDRKQITLNQVRRSLENNRLSGKVSEK